MSFLGWDREGENLRLILDHPDIFPSFYYTPTRHLDRKYLGDIRDFFVATTSRFRWLTLMLYEKSENYLRLFEAWRSWPSHHRSNSADHAEPYYFSPHFPKDFLDFVEDYCKAWEPHTFSFVKSLLAYEHAILAVEEVERAEKSSREGQGECQAELTLDARPLLCNNVVVQTFPFNYIEIIHALQTHRPLDLIPATRTDIIFRRSANGKVETIKVPPVTVRLLQLCDGRSTVADIIRTFQQREGTPERSKIETLCFSGLEALQKRGLISYRTALEKPSLLDKYSQSHRTVLSERS